MTPNGQWPVAEEEWLHLIDAYLADQQATGRINSENSVRAYRGALLLHAGDARLGPLESDRDDVKRTLARWQHPNTRGARHAALRSFYDWLEGEGHRETNPARQVRSVRQRPTSVYRLTRQEAAALMDACQTTRERRIVVIGLCTGARVNELTGLQLRHFMRDGFVWFSPDIAKRKAERWVPVFPELEPVIADIAATCAPGHYVIPGWRRGGGSRPPDPRLRTTPVNIGTVLRAVAVRAGITQHLYPHLLRHAYGDRVAKGAGLQIAQALLGHASVGTTAGFYTGRPDLDELTAATADLRYGDGRSGGVVSG